MFDKVTTLNIILFDSTYFIHQKDFRKFFYQRLKEIQANGMTNKEEKTL